MPRWKNKNCGFQKGHSNFLVKHSQETKKKMSKSAKGKHKFWQGKKMSIEHRRKIRDTLISIRENNHAWKGGITPINKAIRDSLEYKLWREAVFKRDNYQCIWGGKEHSSKLNADHIKRFSDYPELRFAIDNGRTLCIDCHKKTDTFGRHKKQR